MPDYSIIVDLSDHMLYLLDGSQVVKGYPVGIGKMLTQTPNGVFTIINKQENPGGPFGVLWMGLSAPHYGIHGTNDPSSIGKSVSHGCIRMYNSDVLDLSSKVSVGTQVTIRPQSRIYLNWDCKVTAWPRERSHNMRIRPAREGDAEAVAHVHTESWKTTYRGIVPDDFLDNLTTESRLSQWERNIRSGEKDQILVVAEQEDGKIVGFACGGKEREGKLPYDAELYAIYLLKEVQQTGIGQQLARHVVRYLHSLGMRNLLIWALEQNSACRFYEKMGGIPVQTQHIRIGGQDLLEVAYGWEDLTLFGEKPVPGS